MRRSWIGFYGRGFSLVELVLVLMVAGIIAAVVMPRFLNPSSFDSMAARDLILTTARAAQQLALGRDDVALRISSSGDLWLVEARASGAPVISNTFTTNGIDLETGPSAPSTANCASGFDTPVAADFSVTYDGFGNALNVANDAVVEAVDNGVRICINDQDFLAVCISPAGYAYPGNCIE